MNISLYFLLLSAIICSAYAFNEKLNDVQEKEEGVGAFKVIGYYYYTSGGPAAEDLDLYGLSHINYSFVLPAKEGYGLEPFKHSDNLNKLVEIAHKNDQKVFISVGGWNLGDGGGVDSRFHRIAATEAGRKAFVQDIIEFVDTYKLDGVDMDWEYPDADASADHFVALMQSLGEALHKQGKELTAAVVSYNGRLGSNGKVSSALGIKKEVFDIVDWINIMAYDDENGKSYPNPHSTYSLAEKCLHYWIDQRGLPAEKAVLGLPFYGKPGYISYKKLLDMEADPTEDVHDSVFYNGMETIKAKTQLALQRNCSGVMIWEIGQDVKGPHSLVKAIRKVSMK